MGKWARAAELGMITSGIINDWLLGSTNGDGDARVFRSASSLPSVGVSAIH